MEIFLSFITALAVTALSGLVLIPWLRKLKFGQTILEIGPSWHKAKQGTPTIGGLMFIFGITAAVLAVSVGQMRTGDFKGVIVLAPAFCFGAIGFIDDYIKVVKKRNKGLGALQKLTLQCAAAAVYILILQLSGSLNNSLYIPFINAEIHINMIVYIILAAVFIIGTDNAVNLTDGIDGLLSGVTLPVALFFTGTAAFTASGEYYSVSIAASALAGGLIGFLIYNYNPAKVFMGDTGSLFLGGLICGMAFAMDVPLILIIAGLVYYIEMMSVVLQVGYFKLTHGKRLFKMAPIHHHFEKCGWSEKKIFWIFTVSTAALAMLSYIGIYSR